MDGFVPEPIHVQVVRESVALLLGLAENESLLLKEHLEQLETLLVLVVFRRHTDEELLDVLVDSLGVFPNLDVQRVVHETVGELLDVFGPGGTEHAELASGVELAEDLLDLGFEAHVKHAVGLV